MVLVRQEAVMEPVVDQSAVPTPASENLASSPDLAQMWWLAPFVIDGVRFSGR
jgi:hypothetical protein